MPKLVFKAYLVFKIFLVEDSRFTSTFIALVSDIIVNYSFSNNCIDIIDQINEWWFIVVRIAIFNDADFRVLLT